MTNSIDITEDEELDEPELHAWEPLCIDDCELCGCHGGCDPEDQWRWADEMYEEADSVSYDEEEDD